MPRRPEPDARPPPPRRRRWTARLALLILACAALVRIALSAASPCLARDGALYCWQARELGARGVEVIRNGTFDQHPLYSIAILGAQRSLRLGGTPDAPETWELAGRIVAAAAGVAVVALCGLLTWRLVREVGEPPLPVRGAWAALLALAVSAVLPLNVWLSADVMSDQLHAALYLAAACCLTNLRSWPAAIGCGAFAGLAFLTRPEGAVVAAAGLVALLALVRTIGKRAVARRAALLLSAFTVIAGPYIVLSGRLSPKLDKEPLREFQPAAGRPGRPAAQAALVRRDFAWYALAPEAFYQLGRAGRVVVPALAVPAVVALRRRWRTPALLGLAAAAGAHFALCVLLLERHGYLNPRHLLPVVLLLIPFAAGFLAWALAAGRGRGPRVLVISALAAILVALAAYARRVPNEGDGHIREHANWLRSQDGLIQERRLVAGASGRRIAFYADVRWQPWAENEPDAEQRFADLVGHVVFGRADFLALETGPGEELAGNAELLERLRGDGRLAGRIAVLRKSHGRDGFTSHLWAFDWSAR